jgi:TRAP-type C4-dicarboxylate transport system permease small subunit
VAQIFLSYSHHNADKAKIVASALEHEGWTVWWDPEVRSGESFVTLINREIYAADCVVVLWSKRSVNSRWVLEEAHNALNRNILCSVMIEHDAQLPVGFATIKYSPLWEWSGKRPNPEDLKALCYDIGRLIGPPVRVAKVAVLDEQKENIPDAEVPLTTSAEDKESLSVEDTKIVDHAIEPAADATPQYKPRGKFLAAAKQYIDFSDISLIDYPFILAFSCAIAFMLLDVVMRYFFNMPLGLYEISIPLIGLTALFGATIAEKHMRNIKSPISLFIFGTAHNKLLNSFSSFFSTLIFLGILGFYASDLFENYSYYAEEVTIGQLQYPRIFLRFLIFGILLLYSFYSARNLFRSLKNRVQR